VELWVCWVEGGSSSSPSPSISDLDRRMSFVCMYGVTGKMHGEDG